MFHDATLPNILMPHSSADGLVCLVLFELCSSKGVLSAIFYFKIDKKYKNTNNSGNKNKRHKSAEPNYNKNAKNTHRGRSLSRHRNNYNGNDNRSRSRSNSRSKMLQSIKTVNVIDRLQLIELDNQQNAEYIILFFTKNQLAFNKLLSTDDFNIIVLFLRVIGKLCNSNFHDKKQDVINKIITENFLTKLQNEVGSLVFQSDTDKFENKFYWEQEDRFWNDLFKFYETFFCIFPQNIIISNISAHINTLKQLNNTDFIDKFNDLLTRIHQEKESYKNMDILPRPEEVNCRKNPNLKPLKKYSSVEEYLDILYKLSREDYVRTIRNAICNYLENPRFKQSENQIYENVKFIKPVKSYDKIGLKFQLNQKVNSENFLQRGCLVCLSNNRFNDIIFGTIIKQDKDENILKDYCVIDPISISYDRIINDFYVMIETKILFETYSQVLQALQNLSPENFPMKKYIIDGASWPIRPKYLAENCEISLDTPFLINGENLFKFNINLIWPPKEYFSLNSAQYSAFKTALLNEFSIIHGPPGTGKTYTALKITEFLLKYKPNIQYTKPILILCYSNHALDQFFEEIRKFTDNILRIRSKKSIDDSYDIKYHRNMIQHDKKLLDIEQKKVDKCSKKFYCLEKLLDDINSKIGIIDFEHLKKIDKKLYNSWFDKMGNNDIINWLVGETETTNLQKSFYQPHATNNYYPKVTNDEKTVIVTENNLNKFDKNFILNLSDIKAKLKNLENEFSELKRNERSRRDHFLINQREKEILELAKIETYLQEHLHYCNYQPNLQQIVNYSNPFNICKNDRWALYHTWVQQLLQQIFQDIAIVDKEYREAKKKYYEVQNMIDLNIFSQKSVICMTTHTAAKYKSVLQRLKCEIVIVEEAAEILESHIVAAVPNDCQQLILIGDHLQLRPNPQQFELGTNFNLKISLFERMVKQDINYTTLEVQHRMRPEIAKLISPIYNDLKDDVTVSFYSNIRGMTNNLFFITHNQQENKFNTSSKNLYEVDYLLKLASYLIRQEYTTADITILTSYKSQKTTIEQKLENFPDLKNMSIELVDTFQGRENKIILLSLVRSNEKQEIGFLKEENRVCVLLSRAKEGFYMIGNVDSFSRNNNIWTKVVDILQTDNRIGPTLTLKCHVHNRETEINNLQDFDRVLLGGCDFLCGETLNCGHLCQYKCHPQDRVHEHFSCKEICKKVLCEKGHQCPLYCSEPCKPCDEKSERCLPCGHFAEISCSIDPWDHACTHIRTATLNCGHSVIAECNKNLADEICTNDCGKQLNCGHFCKRKCHSNDTDHSLYICRVPTAKKLNNCHHTITLPCLRKMDNRNCDQICGKRISCNHFCKNTCGHGGNCRCNEKVEKIIPTCGHTAKIKCHITPKREYCWKRCQEILECGHPCIKKCNEYCDCGRYCNRNESDLNCCIIL